MKRIVRVSLTALVLVSMAALTAGKVRQEPQDAEPLARRADIYCTGYIADFAPRADIKIIGAEQENLKTFFVEGDVVFMNRGWEAGVQPGALYRVLRPLGEVKHPATRKKVGFWVRELGFVRVMEVQDKTATARITMSCDPIEYGDVLKLHEEIESPAVGDPHPLPRYAEGSGGRRGQIIMSPHAREYLSANQVVYVDLGERQGVRPGDLFTIFRKIGQSEGLTRVPGYEINDDRHKDFGSDRYKGGEYSINATAEKRSKVLRERPEIPRRVLGELVILRVEKSTAVAMITRTTSEVNIGDFIERAN